MTQDGRTVITFASNFRRMQWSRRHHPHRPHHIINALIYKQTQAQTATMRNTTIREGDICPRASNTTIREGDICPREPPVDYITQVDDIVREYVFYIFLKIQKTWLFTFFLKRHLKNVKNRNPKFEISDFADFSLHGISTTAQKQCIFMIYTVSQKNRTLVKFSNISNKSGPMLIIFGTENRQYMFSLRM